MSAGVGAAPRVGDHYRSTRVRLAMLLGSIDDAAWGTPVQACPGWRVRDVVAHLVGVIEDASAGRLSGPPGPEQTAEQLDRHRSDLPADLLAQWAATAPAFEEAISAGARWPAFLDVVSHEHDIRGALGYQEPNSADVDLAGALLAEWTQAPIDIDIAPSDPVLSSGPAAGPENPRIRLRTTAFEVLRFRMGRRTRKQVLALDWSADPGPTLDELFVFGPAAEPVSY